MERVKMIVSPNGQIEQEVLEHNGDCREAAKIGQSLGTVISEEKTADDCPTVHETSNG